MTKLWTTADGTEIPIKNLENSHLLNIKKWIERRAENGVFVGGGTWDIDDIWEYEMVGDEVKDYYDYKSIIKEIKKRKL